VKTVISTSKRALITAEIEHAIIDFLSGKRGFDQSLVTGGGRSGSDK
jgi:hypothetical protein